MLKNITNVKWLGALGALLLTVGVASANPTPFTLTNPGSTQFTGDATKAGSGTVTFKATVTNEAATLDILQVALLPAKSYHSQLKVTCNVTGLQDTGLTGPFADNVFGDKFLGCPFFWLGEVATSASGQVRVN